MTTALAVRETSGVSTLQKALLPQSFAEVMRFAEAVAKTAFAPKDFAGKPEAILAAVTYGAELGLSPMQSLQGVVIINGKPALYGDAMLAVCQSHPAWGGKEERIEGEGETRTAHCIVRRKGEPDVHSTFSVGEARKAGLWGKAGPWTQYPDRMLLFRARGFGLRDQFADALRGIISREEAEDYPTPGSERARDVTPPKPQGPISDPAELVELFDQWGSACYMTPGEVDGWIADRIKECDTEELLKAFVAANVGDTPIALKASEKLEEMKTLLNIVNEHGKVIHQSNDPRTLATQYRASQKLARDKIAFGKANLGLLYALADSGKFRNGNLETLQKEIEAIEAFMSASPVDEAELVAGEA